MTGGLFAIVGVGQVARFWHTVLAVFWISDALVQTLNLYVSV